MNCCLIDPFHISVPSLNESNIRTCMLRQVWLPKSCIMSRQYRGERNKIVQHTILTIDFIKNISNCDRARLRRRACSTFAVFQTLSRRSLRRRDKKVLGKTHRPPGISDETNNAPDLSARKLIPTPQIWLAAHTHTHTTRVNTSS